MAAILDQKSGSRLNLLLQFDNQKNGCREPNPKKTWFTMTKLLVVENQPKKTQPCIHGATSGRQTATMTTFPSFPIFLRECAYCVTSKSRNKNIKLKHGSIHSWEMKGRSKGRGVRKGCSHGEKWIK